MSSPVRLVSVAGAVAALINPWPTNNITVVVVQSLGGKPVSVPFAMVPTPAGSAITFNTTADERLTYVVSRIPLQVDLPQESVDSRGVATQIDNGGTKGENARAHVIACTAFSTNCTACMAANDTRKDWASPCVYLSGPSEGGARCQPSKWWFPPCACCIHTWCPASARYAALRSAK